MTDSDIPVIRQQTWSEFQRPMLVCLCMSDTDSPSPYMTKYARIKCVIASANSQLENTDVVNDFNDLDTDKHFQLIPDMSNRLSPNDLTSPEKFAFDLHGFK